MKHIQKDPDAVLDYTYDWSDWLTGTDVISASAVTVESGDVVIDTQAADTTAVTAWISGGTVGQSIVTCHITTTEGRQDDRSFAMRIIER